MAAPQSLPLSSGVPSSKPETLTDFVLFSEGEDSIYYDHRQTSFIHQNNPPFHQQPIHSDNYITSSTSRVEVVDSWGGMLGHQSSMDNLHSQQQQQQQQQEAKSFYTMELPPASSASSFNGYPTAYAYNVSDIPSPIAFTEDPSMPPAPGVLVHPPTFHFPSHLPQEDYRQSPFPSPATSAGGWDGHSSVASGVSVSEAGSNSPYLNDDHSLFNPAYATGTYLAQIPITFLWQLLTSATDNINPSLISIPSPAQQNEDAPASASSFGSPSWHSAQSPPPISNPPSPVFGKAPKAPGSIGRLSPFPVRAAPYPSRRQSVSSQGSRKSHGSPSGPGNNLEWHEELHAVQADVLSEEQMRRAASVESHRSRGNRAPSSSASVPSSHSGVGSVGKDTVCPECNKSFRDLRAHQLTHQLERPVKCPIATCEYSKKGFARKYDCQRHTLTHYKGTMVCGFCPGSGSAVEKSFNRADVFKRHLMSVHNVEQTPPNGRKKIGSKQGSVNASPTDAERYSGAFITGKCSICAVTFATAQQFYEHLDECVQLKVVQEEPAAAFNEMNLGSVKLEDMEPSFSVSSNKHGRRSNKPEDDDEEEEGDEEEDLPEEGEDGADDGKDETFTPSGRKSNGKLGRNGSRRATRGGAKKAVSGNGSGGSRQR